MRCSDEDDLMAGIVGDLAADQPGVAALRHDCDPRRPRRSLTTSATSAVEPDARRQAPCPRRARAARSEWPATMLASMSTLPGPTTSPQRGQNLGFDVVGGQPNTPLERFAVLGRRNTATVSTWGE